MPRRPAERKRHVPSRRPTFRRLLVAVDLSGRNAQALRIARTLALENRAGVTLLHVVQQLADTPPAELESFYRRLVQRARRRLEALAVPFAVAGIAVRTEVVIGQPAREIVRTAARQEVDLLVMASHRVRPGRPALGWGTTSYKVGIFCECPILLVK